MSESDSIRLEPSYPAHLLALIECVEKFEAESGMRVATGLREMYGGSDVSPEWLAALRTSASPDPWRLGFFVVLRDSELVVGTAGYKGPPDPDGVVEIAYGIAPPFQGRGLATAAARALLEWAKRDRVRLFRAHTLPEQNASTRVLTKCGFSHKGGVIDPDDGPVWRWERLP